MRNKPYDTWADLIERFGEPAHRIVVPADFPSNFNNDLPDEYAVWLNDTYAGCCLIASRYREDDWVVNPTTTRPLIWLLLNQPKL